MRACSSLLRAAPLRHALAASTSSLSVVAATAAPVTPKAFIALQPRLPCTRTSSIAITNANVSARTPLPVPTIATRALSTASATVPTPVPLIRTTDTTPEVYREEAGKVLNSILERIEADDIDGSFDNDITFTGDVLQLKAAASAAAGAAGKTWVLNKHNVTRQLWLSSPLSGPSKYNYHAPASESTGGVWLSERDGETRLAAVLMGEFGRAFGVEVQFDHEF